MADLITMYKHAGIADENDGKAVRKMERNVVVSGREGYTDYIKLEILLDLVFTSYKILNIVQNWLEIL